jgi:hypothetical protein
MTDISRIVKIWNKSSPVPVFNAYRTFLDDTMGSNFQNFD